MNQNGQIAIAVGAVTVLGGALWYAFHQGQKTNSPVSLPNDTLPEINYLEKIAGELYDDMKGVNIFFNHDFAPYQSALALSNTDFTALYNTFNAKYQSEWTETLTKVLQDQFADWGSGWEGIKAAMLARLNSLNLP